MSRSAFRNTPIVGVEDESFQKGITPKALLAAVLFKGLKIENVQIMKITVDGLDATQKLVKTLRAWTFRAVILGCVSFAGFNLVDPTIVYEEFRKPVIVISRTKPDNKAVKRALQRHFEDWQTCWAVFEKLGLIHTVLLLINEPPVYVETVSAPIKWPVQLIRGLSVYSRIPEPIRTARLIARGLS